MVLPMTKRLKRVEYELIVFAFLLLRFVFKNVLGLQTYFTQEKVFGLSGLGSILLGAVVLTAACVYLASMGSRLIRREKKEDERPLILLACLLFACPAALPFLFDTDNLSGTQMLYPFALFLLAAFCAGKRAVRWFVPVICALFFIPAVHSGEVFFAALRKGALVYVPLILLLLFMQAETTPAAPRAKKQSTAKAQTRSGGRQTLSAPNLLFIAALLVSVFAYAYTLFRGKRYSEAFFDSYQPLDGYFFIALAVCAPLLAALGTVLTLSAGDRRIKRALLFLVLTAGVMLVLCADNYYGLWIPFLVISMSLVVFNQVSKENAAVLAAVRRVGDFCWKYNYLFFIVLLVTALFSDTTSSFVSDTTQKIFDKIPY